jgi:TIR domain/Pentapeptide repeats (8 copies)
MAALNRSALDGADFSRADLNRARLNGASLIGARFSSANLFLTQLQGADLRKAEFIWADLNMANLCEANLSGAELIGTRISNAFLRGTDFSGASLSSAAFINVDLSEAHGLVKAKHSTPSTIGIDTIYRSQGKIPHTFLRKAGVPSLLVDNIAGLVGTGIEFYSLFISYSTKDQAFADRLYADLQAKGVRCWFAPHEMLGGRKIVRQIDEAIRMYDKLLLILSPASMESEWVRTEIAIARKREKEQDKEVLFPIALCQLKRVREWEYFDSDIGKDSAREVREYHIPNFTKWKTDQDAYQKEFSKLLKALQGNAPPIGA